MEVTETYANGMRWTLGTWREMLDPKTRGANIAAGLVVAMVALPLNLALAVACGLPPSAGLLSGAIGGAIAALFGGARLNVTGPEVALAPLTALIVGTHGIDGLMVATAIAGFLQIGLGLTGVGTVVRMLPRPVVGGFLAAVGIMVLDSQLPHVLGIHDGTRLIGATSHVLEGAVDYYALGLGVAVALVLVVGPRLAPRVPAPLVALTLAIGAVALFGLDVQRLDPVHESAVALRFPDFASIDLWGILPSAIALAALASVDTLLCAASVDRRMGGEPHRPGQELVAQGVANLACAALGAMPVASAIVRSVAAIEARGSTRLCGVVQSGVLLAVLLALGPHLDHVPLAALSGVLLVVGAKLIDVRELATLVRVRRIDALVFVVTTVGVVALGFLEGLLMGSVLAMMGLVRSSAAALRVKVVGSGDPMRVWVRGPLVFASQERLAAAFERCTEGAEEVVVDLSGVNAWDTSGLAALRTGLAPVAKRARVVLDGAGIVPDDALRRELGDLVAVLEPPAGGRVRTSLSPPPSLALDLEPAE